MPRPATEMAERSGLDGDTLRKLKQHNRNFHQQKKEAAAALKQKLEEWKKEKRKQKEHEQKKPFVTTVLKPLPTKPQSMTQNKPPPPRKSAYGPSKAMSKPAVSLPAKKPGKPVSAMVKPQPKPQELLGGQKREEKENKKPGGQPVRAHSSIASKPPVLPKQGKAPEVRRKISKPSAPEMETPLRGKTTDIGKRHAIAYFAKATEQGGEMVRPKSLADELQAATSSTEGSTAQSQPVGEPFITIGNSADSHSFDESVDDEVIINYNNTSLSQVKGASRDSLTKRFRKSKQQSLPVKKNSALIAPRRSLCAPNVSEMKKAPKSAPSSRSSIANPRKSILKRKSIVADPSSALGASPELPVSKPCQTPSMTQDRTTSLKRKIVEGEDQAQIKAAEVPSSGHVCFVTPPIKVEEGAHYRKTPGKVKSEELMRSKLNEWLAAKGRTPITFRHTACFHGDGEVSQPSAPRSQIKASMSVEQLSRQEKALDKEDLQSIRQRLEWTGKKRQSITYHSLPSLPPRTNASTIHTTHNSTRKSMTGNKADAKHTTRKRTHQSVGSQRSVCFETAEEAERKEGLSPSKKRLTSSPVAEGSASGSSARVGGGQSLEVCSGSAEELNAEFQKCLAALESGMLGAVEVLEWLNVVGEASEEARRQAGWYKCRVATLKQLGNEDAILAAFEQAIIHNAQPAEELAELLTTTMKELLSEHTTQRGRRKLRTRSIAEPSPSSRRSRSCGQVAHIPEVEEENVFESTVVKFSVKEVTPFKKRRRTSDLDEKLVSVVTPVRRSTRRSSSMVTGSSGGGRLLPGTPQVVEYSALEEVPSAEKQQMLFVHNWALESVTDVSLEVARKAESPRRTSVTSEEDTAAEAVTE